MNYLVRFLDATDTPTGWHCVINATSKDDLFWAIDEFGDPTSCEIKEIPKRAISFCFKCDDELEVSKFEFSEGLAGEIDETKWHVPKWNKRQHKLISTSSISELALW